MIVGFTGRYAAGKTEAAQYLARHGYHFHSLSDIIRDEIRSRGDDVTRDRMIEVGNELRREHGPGVLAERTVTKIRQNGDDWAVDSIRNPAEVKALQELDDFLLIGIHAPIEQRLERLQDRGREGDPSTMEELREKEEAENSDDDTGQQLDATFELADIYVANDSSLQSLYKQLDKVLGGYA